MPAPDCYETPRSREGSKEYAGAGLTREFVVRFTDDLGAAIDLVEAAADATFEGMDRKALQWRSLGAPDLWLFTVPYGAGAAGGALRPDQCSFTATAASVHITQSKQTRLALGRPVTTGVGAGTNLVVDAGDATIVTPTGRTVVPADVGRVLVVTGGTGFTPGAYVIGEGGGGQWTLDGAGPAAPGTAGGIWKLFDAAPDNGGAIGVDRDTVHGCDIVVPAGDITYTCNVTDLDETLYRTLRAVIGKTNAAEFRGFPAGTLLYLGFTPTSSAGSLPTGQPFTWWALAHTFRYEPHATNVDVGGIIIPFKGGHEYLWAVYQPTPDANALVMRPTAVYTERVYDSASFDDLGVTL